MFLRIDGLDIFYKKAGSGKPVLLLHGWGGSSDSFLPVFNSLRFRFEVYAMDFPGFGRSSTPPSFWGIEEYADITYKFLNMLGINRVHVIAHSFGGRVAILLSALHPEMVEKLVLVNSAGLIPKRSLKYYFKVYSFKLLRRVYTFLGKDLEKLYKRFGSKDYREAGELRPIFKRVVNQDLRGYLPLIKAKTLLIWGDQDRDTPIYFGKVMEKEIPNAKLVVFKGTGHFSYLENTSEFNRLVSEFLEGD
ncbi:MAG: alpha/beta hydrolase [Synergistetes bacterium]|nr:alpha/beta hydrolase [Synergistota bacterium]MDW8192941.1 alpha/beta hydrolase [Synergistota bacterium]